MILGSMGQIVYKIQGSNRLTYSKFSGQVEWHKANVLKGSVLVFVSKYCHSQQLEIE
jgi:hypothetical protein